MTWELRSLPESSVDSAPAVSASEKTSHSNFQPSKPVNCNLWKAQVFIIVNWSSGDFGGDTVEDEAKVGVLVHFSCALL